MAEEIRIRRGTAGDVAAIAALTHDAYRKWIAVIGRLPVPMETDYARALLEHRFDLLECDGRLAGLLETLAEPEAMLVVNVAVHPDFQRRGFGRRLMALAERMAREAGLPAIRLYTHQLYAENIRLYESIGYVVTSKSEFRGGIRVDMAKPLV